MSDPQKQTQTIQLTRKQQLEVLAATGLLVQTLEVDTTAIAADGTVSARLPLPEWLVEPPPDPVTDRRRNTMKTQIESPTVRIELTPEQQFQVQEQTRRPVTTLKLELLEPRLTPKIAVN